MAWSRRLLSNATVAVVQTMVSGLILFFLYRYLIEHLGAEQLGLWSVILASTSVARISDMGLGGGVVKFVASSRARNDNDQAARVIQTAALSIALVMGVLALAIYPLLGSLLKLAIPIKAMPEALGILPWAVLSLWLGSVTGVFQSGLDGCQRMDLRNIVIGGGNVVLLIAAICLVPVYGLEGLAIGQAGQGILLAVASWLLLRYQLPQLPKYPKYWSKAQFREMFGYAVNFQIISIASLLFEPLTKLLMSRYGGLFSVAYYEMANQLIVKLRALLISANQALVPAVAELHETAPSELRELYLKAYNLLFLVAMPFYGAILISLPMVSMLWIGHVEDQFLMFGALWVVGWGLNSLISPAYFFNLGVGELKWNTTALVLMSIINALLGLTLGIKLGGLGVAVGAMAALVIASGVVLMAAHMRYKIPFQNIVPSDHYVLLIVVSGYTALTLWANAAQLHKQDAVFNGVINLGIYLILVGMTVWFHPYKKVLTVKLRGRSDAIR